MHMEKYKREAVSGVTKHNARVWEGRGFERENIDNGLIGLDYNLAPERGDAVAWVNSRIDALDLKRAPRKDAVRMCEWVVTLPRDVPEAEARAFFGSAYRTLAAEYGEGNVVGAWVHLDEPGARQHMHFDFVPVTKDGRLSARDIMTRQHLRQMHPKVQEAAERDLGHAVHVLLPEEEREARAGMYVGLPEYKAARDALRVAEEMASEARQEAAGAKVELESVQKSVEDGKSALAASRAAQMAAATEAARLAGEVARLRETKATADGEQRDAWRRAEDAARAADEARARLEAVRSQVAEHEARLEGLQRAEEAAERDCAAIEGEIAGCAGLGERERAARKANSRLTRAVEKARRGLEKLKARIVSLPKVAEAVRGGEYYDGWLGGVARRLGEDAAWALRLVGVRPYDETHEDPWERSKREYWERLDAHAERIRASAGETRPQQARAEGNPSPAEVVASIRADMARERAEDGRPRGRHR